MSEHGRGTTASAAQRAQVRQLIAEGCSIRETAAKVFGDARYRGRVERILRTPSGPSTSPGSESDEDLSELPPTQLLRLLFERRLAWVASREVPPSASELHHLLKVQLMLHHREALERSIAATRETADTASAERA
jgi:hypothetical protein